MREHALSLIGARIRTLRKDSGLSQEDMARRAGIERAYYGRIERGAANVGVEMLVRVAEGLDVDLAELVVDVVRTPSEPS